MSVVDLDQIDLQIIGVAGEIEEQSTMLAAKLDHIIHLLQLLTGDKPVKQTKRTERKGQRNATRKQ
jgi:hypothetical protein